MWYVWALCGTCGRMARNFADAISLTAPPLQVSLISDSWDLADLRDNGGGKILGPISTMPATVAAVAHLAQSQVAGRGSNSSNSSSKNNSSKLQKILSGHTHPRIVATASQGDRSSGAATISTRQTSASQDTVVAGSSSRDILEGGKGSGSGSEARVSSASVRRGSACAVLEAGSTPEADSLCAPPRGRSFEHLSPLSPLATVEGGSRRVAEPTADEVLWARDSLPLEGGALPPQATQSTEGGPPMSMGIVSVMSKRSSGLGSTEYYRDGPISRATPPPSATSAPAFPRVDFSQLEPNVQRRTAGILRMHVVSSVRGHIEAGHLDFINEIRPLTCLFIGFPSLLDVSDTANHQDQLGCVQFVVCQIQEVMRK